MEYVVYCDESRHDGADHNRYMAIGSLWLPRGTKEQLTREFRELRESVGLKGDIKRYLKIRRECKKFAP